MTVVGVFNIIFYQVYFVVRVKRLMKGLCPDDKMSCFGKFRRNAINFQENLRLSILFGLGAIVNLLCNRMFVNFESVLEPKTIFYINTCYWIIFTQVPYIYLTIAIAIKGIPCVKQLPENITFYVRKPVLKPRRYAIEKPFNIPSIVISSSSPRSSCRSRSIRIAVAPIQASLGAISKTKVNIKQKKNTLSPPVYISTIYSPDKFPA